MNIVARLDARDAKDLKKKLLTFPGIASTVGMMVNSLVLHASDSVKYSFRCYVEIIIELDKIYMRIMYGFLHRASQLDKKIDHNKIFDKGVVSGRIQVINEFTKGDNF